ncbi:MAG: IMP cyclohydrolase, partial [Oscillospiraceae bacterium]|nr:IMP cyclohydrolase [Oscillospiraceae bacterium]
IVTNGNQTDTIYEGLKEGKSFAESLSSRTFEPDAPNYTPRISAVLDIESGSMAYEMSILRTEGGDPEAEVREFFGYEAPQVGTGHFFRTYFGAGEPIPSYEEEPALISTEGWGEDPEAIAKKIWEAMNEDNKVSLFVRVTDLEDNSYKDSIINKLQ